MRRVIQLISSFILTRLLTKSVLKLNGFIIRILSNLKFKALIPRSGNSLCHYTTEIKYGKNITIGNYCKIGRFSSLGAKSPITIGDFVTLSRGVILETAGLDMNGERPYKHYSKPIVIEDGVWIATNVMVLGGVTIKKNALIGAGVIVTKDVNEGEIIVGSQNRILKRKIFN